MWILREGKYVFMLKLTCWKSCMWCTWWWWYIYIYMLGMVCCFWICFHTCPALHRHMLLLLATLYAWKTETRKTIFIWERELECVGGCAVPVMSRSPTHQMRMSLSKAQRIMLRVCWNFLFVMQFFYVQRRKLRILWWILCFLIHENGQRVVWDKNRWLIEASM